tara:strand:- start:3442 stop:3822 length:381 start_codon:yes stop_codon:yes gene_type:complete
MNKVILKGRLGQDWELVTTTNDVSVAKTSLATSEKYKDKETTHWHRLVAWNKTAEIVSQYTNKGDEILIEGKVTYNEWEDKEGNKRKTTEIIVERFHFIGGKLAAPEKVEALPNFGKPKKVDDLPF